MTASEFDESSMRDRGLTTMSVAEAMPESVPESVPEETTEKLPPEESKPAGALRTDSEVKVRGQSIRISEFLKLFDPECPRRCKEGVIKIGRPNKMSPGGILWVPELCDCTVKRWLEENPAPVTAGTLAEMAIERAEGKPAAAPAPAESLEHPRTKQVKRLRERAGELRDKLAAVELALSEKISPLAEALEREDLERGDRTFEACQVSQQLVDVRDELGRLGARERDLVAQEEAAVARAAEAIARAQDLRTQIENVRATRRHDTNPLQKDLEKVERRLKRVLDRHPEAGVDPG